MNDAGNIAWLAVSFVGGVALGGVFFGGLWLTARSLPHTAGAPLLVIVSFIARTAFVLVGLYWLTAGDWRSVLVCLTGFLLARTIIIKQICPAPPTDSRSLEALRQ